MNYSEFSHSLAQSIVGSTGRLGFENVDDSLFVRSGTNHEINIISIQKHSSTPTVSLNFGVHYDFLPKLGSQTLPKDGTIELADCEIKIRITPDVSQEDYWWPIEQSSVGEMSRIIDERAKSFFDRYRIDGEIAKVTVDELATGTPDILSCLTKVRACLVLATIHELRGEVDQAADFARLGIKAAGMAVGPKKMLKTLLERIERRKDI